MVSSNRAVRIRPRERCPQLGLSLWVVGCRKDHFRRNDADHVVALVIECNFAADNIRIRREMRLPERLAENDDVTTSSLVFLRQENVPEAAAP